MANSKEVTVTRKRLTFTQDKRTDLVSVELGRLIDSLHEDMHANAAHPAVQRYIQLLLQQLELVGVPT